MDANSVRFSGEGGEIKWAYHTAASLSSWSIRTDSNGHVILTAKVVSADTFKASQAPLTFHVPRPSGQAWSWPISSLQISDTHATATLGSQE
jgi:hypothetical protein